MKQRHPAQPLVIPWYVYTCIYGHLFHSYRTNVLGLYYVDCFVWQNVLLHSQISLFLVLVVHLLVHCIGCTWFIVSPLSLSLSLSLPLCLFRRSLCSRTTCPSSPTSTLGWGPSWWTGWWRSRWVDAIHCLAQDVFNAPLGPMRKNVEGSSEMMNDYSLGDACPPPLSNFMALGCHGSDTPTMISVFLLTKTLLWAP